jgi:hypothetical protein
MKRYEKPFNQWHFHNWLFEKACDELALSKNYENVEDGFPCAEEHVNNYSALELVCLLGEYLTEEKTND